MGGGACDKDVHLAGDVLPGSPGRRLGGGCCDALIAGPQGPGQQREGERGERAGDKDVHYAKAALDRLWKGWGERLW